CGGQHPAFEVEQAGAGTAGADIDTDHIAVGSGRIARRGSAGRRAHGYTLKTQKEGEGAGFPSYRSTLFGRMTRSRMVTLRGRDSMNSTASATSFGCIRLPLASASSILAFGQSSSRAVTTGPGRTAPTRTPCCAT